MAFDKIKLNLLTYILSTIFSAFFKAVKSNYVFKVYIRTLFSRKILSEVKVHNLLYSGSQKDLVK